MKKILGVLLAASVALSITSIVIALHRDEPRVAPGSVVISNEYQSVRLGSGNASATTYTTVFSGRGVLGSLVISSTTPATATSSIRIYDSSVSTTTASSTKAIFGRATAEGTYTFDAQITAGMIVEVTPGYDGVAELTYRTSQ